MELGEEIQFWKDGAIRTQSATHYPVDGSLGAAYDSMVTERFVFDTGTGCNVIR